MPIYKANSLPAAATLDALASLATGVPRVRMTITPSSAGVDSVHAGFAANDLGAKAFRDLTDGDGNGDLDTVVEATSAGVGGNALSVVFTGDSGLGAGVSISRIGNDFTIHFEAGVSIVSDVETAIGNLAGDDDLIGVKTVSVNPNTVLGASAAFSVLALQHGGSWTGTITSPDVARNVVVDFPAAWDGSNVLVRGTDKFGVVNYEVFTPDPGNVVVGTVIFGSVDFIERYDPATPGASTSECTVGVGNKIGMLAPLTNETPVLLVDDVAEAVVIDETYYAFTPTTLPDGAHVYKMVSDVDVFIAEGDILALDDVDFSAKDGVVSVGPNDNTGVMIRRMTPVPLGTSGGQLTIRAALGAPGSSNSAAGAGGYVALEAGIAGTDKGGGRGNGGSAYVRASAGKSGGDTFIDGGNGTGGLGGWILLSAGSAGNDDHDGVYEGGSFYVSPGNGSDGGATHNGGIGGGYYLDFQSGGLTSKAGGTGGRGGDFEYYGGVGGEASNATATPGRGGDFRLAIGAAGAGGLAGARGGLFSVISGVGSPATAYGAGGAGGNASTVAGDGGGASAGFAAGNGGSVDLNGGAGGEGTATKAGGSGGAVSIYAGNAGADGGGGTGTGGNITVQPGVSTDVDASGQFICPFGMSITTDTTRPTADAAHRGQMWVVRGAGGDADILYICIKNAADGYEWKVVTLT